jgi:hypothetical protein
MKLLDLFLLKVAVWVLFERNVGRCKYISRIDNNSLWYMGEKIEAIIVRIHNDYRAEKCGDDPYFSQQR